MSDAIDLVTLERVRTALRTPSGDTDLDARLAEAITDVSEHLIEAYEREFAPVGHDLVTRSFTYRGGGILDLSPWNAQAGTITTVSRNAETTSPTAMVAGTDWFPMPAQSRHGVVDYLRFPSLTSQALWRVDGLCRVDVTANWGYPVIPRSVSEAALVTVMDWYRRDNLRPGGFAEGDGDEEQAQDVAIPQRARWLLRSFERLVVA